jgi:hypothetical protein
MAERPNWDKLSLSLLRACGICGNNATAVRYEHRTGQPPSVEVDYNVIGFGLVESKTVRFVPESEVTS